VQAEYRGEGFQEGVPEMARRQFTFGSADQTDWLDPHLIGEVVWREGVPYRVLGIYFGGNPDQQDDKLYQWWIGEQLRPCDVPHWYALEVELGREREVEEALQDAGIDCLLPCLFFGPERPSRTGEGCSVEFLFPGYIFVRLAPADYKWEVVAGLHGVKGVVAFGGSPAPVPDELPNALLALSLGSGCLVYRGGRLLDYGAGPLSPKLEGLLSMPLEEGARGRFLLDMLAEGTGARAPGQDPQTIRVHEVFGPQRGLSTDDEGF